MLVSSPGKSTVVEFLHLSVRVLTIEMNMRGCLSVCLSAHLKHVSKFHYIFCIIHGLVLFRQQCSVLCTSGFVDNMLSHNGSNETESDDVIFH